MTSNKQQNNVEEVTVKSRSHAYSVKIGTGLLDSLGTEIGKFLSRPFTVIVTDDNVAPLYLEHAVKSLSDAGIDARTIILPAGENIKSIDSFAELSRRLIECGVERSDTIIALGGGVIGDLTGFVASVFYRGISFIQIPTTLLAQVDSSVGGKTGINTEFGKNLIGSFWQPVLVLADLDVLDSLPVRHLQAGYAEVLKYALIDDPDFFTWLNRHGTAFLAGSKPEQAYAIKHCVTAKARIVADDEFEAGSRALLNLGHTFAHALESWTGLSDELYHGEAVAIGLVLASELSAELDLADPRDKKRVEEHLNAHGMLTSLKGLSQRLNRSIDVDALINFMKKDKKVSSGKINFILGPIGAVTQTKIVDLSVVKHVLERSLNHG